MKKKLSSETLFNTEGLCFFFCCFMCVILYAGFLLLVCSVPRTQTVSQDFKIPVVSSPLEDKGYSLNKPSSTLLVGNSSLTIVLDKFGNIYYEDSGSFSKGNFFKVASLEGGAINIEKLEQGLISWLKQRKDSSNPVDNQVTIFSPDPSLPLEVVVNFISELKQKELVSTVVLASNIVSR